MTLGKRNIFLSFTTLHAILFISILPLFYQSTAQTIEEKNDIPEWFLNIPDNPNFIFSTTTATSRDLETAVQKASNWARAEISRQIEIKIRSRETHFLEEIENSENNEILQFFSTATKTATASTLRGSKILRKKVVKEKNIWRAYIIMAYPAGEAALLLKNDMNKHRSTLAQVIQTKAYQKLEREVHKYEKWKNTRCIWEEIEMPIPSHFPKNESTKTKKRPPKENKIPDWYINIPEDPNYITEVATATSKDLGTAIQKATTLARANLSRHIKIEVTSKQEHFFQEIEDDDKDEILEYFIQATKTVSSTVLTGSRVANKTIIKEKSIWRAYVLVTYPNGQIASLLKNNIENNKKLYTKFLASKAMQDLDREIREYEAWKKSQDFREEIEMPRFDWPPPKASATATIPTKFLVNQNSNYTTLEDVCKRLQRAFNSSGYGEYSLYAISDGFAMTSRLEQIEADGTPAEPPYRWSLKVSPTKVFSLKSYVTALFTANKGNFRVIVFALTKQPLKQYPHSEVSSKDASKWINRGTNTLPPTIGCIELTDEYQCIALIYEFQQLTPDHEAEIKTPSSITGKTHLIKSKLWQALENPKIEIYP